jgi:hypothetical protein
MALVPPALTDWVADSSASKHTTSDAGNLTFICSPHTSDPSSIIVGNRFSLLITSVGDMTLPDPFYLNNVLVTHDIIQNLLSVRRFTTNNWCSMEFDPFGLSVKDLSTRNVIMSYPVPRKRERSLYTCAQDVQITRMATIDKQMQCYK